MDTRTELDRQLEHLEKEIEDWEDKRLYYGRKKADMDLALSRQDGRNPTEEQRLQAQSKDYGELSLKAAMEILRLTAEARALGNELRDFDRELEQSPDREGVEPPKPKKKLKR